MPKNKIESIEACVFDALGTLLDFHSVAAQSRDDLVDKADQGSNSWRKKQLQYSWFQSLMQKFVPLWQVTIDALDFVHVRNPSRTIRRYAKS